MLVDAVLALGSEIVGEGSQAEPGAKASSERPAASGEPDNKPG
jgi:hypothetical protein